MIRPTIQILDDNSPMPFGKKYRGIKMEDVPVSYLHWIWCEVKTGDIALQEVRDYIFRNLDALKEEDSDRIWED